MTVTKKGSLTYSEGILIAYFALEHILCSFFSSEIYYPEDNEMIKFIILTVSLQ